jgi:uncharacterized protein YecE (DUF72 family)
MLKRLFRSIARFGAPAADSADSLLLYIGTTTGHHYGLWNGDFYPSGLIGTDMRGYCAQPFDTIEIRSSFYRMPNPEMFANWADQAPAEFRFALLASSRITHLQRLNGAEEATRYFLRATNALGPRRGPLLFQLPAGFTLDKARFARFLELLPADVSAAFEFPDPSWHDDAIYKELHRRNYAVSVGDSEAGASSFVATADWGYVRLGRADYSDRDLTHWLNQIRSPAWRAVYVYFRHEDEARAQDHAQRLEALAAGNGSS